MNGDTNMSMMNAHLFCALFYFSPDVSRPNKAVADKTLPSSYTPRCIQAKYKGGYIKVEYI